MSQLKTKIFLIILFIIGGLAIYGYFNAAPEVSKNSFAVPKIEASSRFFDFGVIKYGDIAEHSFVIKNKGKKVLKIKKIATSCACTSAFVEKKELKPGEETTIVVRYNTSLMKGLYAKGKQKRIIYIQTNDPRNPQIEFVIYAYVK